MKTKLILIVCTSAILVGCVKPKPNVPVYDLEPGVYVIIN